MASFPRYDPFMRGVAAKSQELRANLGTQGEPYGATGYVYFPRGYEAKCSPSADRQKKEKS